MILLHYKVHIRYPVKNTVSAPVVCAMSCSSSGGGCRKLILKDGVVSTTEGCAAESGRTVTHVLDDGPEGVAFARTDIVVVWGLDLAGVFDKI
jgi:hypothetical protein